MKCHLCSGVIEIHTDPKNHDFIVQSGARRKVETYDREGEVVIKTYSEEQKKQAEENPFYALEKKNEDKEKLKDSTGRLQELYELSERRYGDPFGQSQKLRRIFREEKTLAREIQTEKDEVRNRLSLGVSLLDASKEDAIEAAGIRFGDHSSGTNKRRPRNKISEARLAIQSRKLKQANGVVSGSRAFARPIKLDKNLAKSDVFAKSSKIDCIRIKKPANREKRDE